MRHRDPCAIHHGRVWVAWASALQEELLPRDVFMSAICCAARSMVKARQPWNAVHGPAGTLLLVACRLGWKILDHLTVVTDLGKQLSLLECSGKDLVHEVRRATERWIGVSSGLGGQHFWYYPVGVACRKLSALERACLEIKLCHGSWCQLRLWRKGMVSSSLCPACGLSEGSEYHRVFECTYWKQMRLRHFSEELKAWLCSTQGQSVAHQMVEGHLGAELLGPAASWHGTVVREGEAGAFEGLVCIDGSSMAPRDECLRRSGWSV
eukprot:5926208-Amphidinium_carterae.1